MKKLFLTAAVVGALAAPAAPAAASDIPQPVGTKPCPAGFVGVVVWTNTEPTGYDEHAFCFHSPDAAPGAESAIPPPVGTKPCPAPYVRGFILWVNTGPTGYHEEWFCIPGGPS